MSSTSHRSKNDNTLVLQEKVIKDYTMVCDSAIVIVGLVVVDTTAACMLATREYIAVALHSTARLFSAKSLNSYRRIFVVRGGPLPN